MTANLTLTYGSLNLTASPYLIEFGLDTGAPQNVYEAMAFLLQDGEIELSNRASNRAVQFNVLIEGANLTALATAEAALILETEKTLNLITIDPGDGAPASVYETFRGQVTVVRDDAWELAGMRRLTVTVKAYPSVRSVAPFTSAGVAPGGSTTTSLDACGATTGWSATVDAVAGTVTNAAGPPTTVAVSSSVNRLLPHVFNLQKTFAATTTTTNLLQVDWKATPVGSVLSATGDGVALPKFAEAVSPTSGYTRTWFQVAASSLAVTVFSLRTPSSGTPLTATYELRLDQVSVTNVVPITGTNRQQLRSLYVPGSAPTQGSLAIESATAALGDAIVYVYPPANAAGYSPSLRQFRSAGNAVTSDSTLVSGAREPLNAPGITFTIPIGLFPPGTYVLMARIALASSASNGTISITTQTKLGSNNIGAATTASADVALTTTYKTFVLTRLQLPTVDLDPASPASMEMVLSTSGAVWLTDVRLDEAWLFNTTIGQLTKVDCGTGAGAVGGSSRRLFIEPATVDTPRPTVRVGHSADRSDAYYPFGALTSWQRPQFDPPQVNALLVTPNATDAVISLSGYARWHTNAAS